MRVRPVVSRSDALISRLWRLKTHLMFTQREMADLMGVAPCTMSNWATKRKNMSIKSMRRLDELERFYELPFDIPFPDHKVIVNHRQRSRRDQRVTVDLDFNNLDPRNRRLWVKSKHGRLPADG